MDGSNLQELGPKRAVLRRCGGPPARRLWTGSTVLRSARIVRTRLRGARGGAVW